VEALYHPDDSDNDPRRDVRATGIYGRWSISSEVVVRRPRMQLGHFLWLLCFLLFSAIVFVLWISPRYKWRRHGLLPLSNGGGVSPSAASAERSPLSCTHRLWDLGVGTIAYVG